MAIERIDVNVTSPGRNFVTARITTSDGLTGLGDGTLNGRELAVASYLRDHVAPTLIGRDESQIESIWQYLYRSPYWRRGPVTMAAVAAIDMALWDIAAKKAGEPLYKLLGGASRIGLLSYAHASGTTIDTLNDAIRGYLEQGFQAVRIQAGVPGLGRIYGVHDAAPGGTYEYEPAGRAAAGAAMRPTEETGETAAYLRHLPTVFAGVREEFGPELHLLHDGPHRMTPIEAARLAKSLEPCDPFWLEDCTPGEDQTVLRLAPRHSVTPLAIHSVGIQEYMPHSETTLSVFRT
ncbi:MAG: bifunctional D-altronate/D-mannonate dehydratase, partial [Brachybacterium sp.]|nr:bifunctional D-altronate/D-mannonate dehydratase [Brachybacterium sp.]